MTNSNTVYITAIKLAADTIDSCRDASARAWEGAADGAERDGHDRAPVEAAAEECDAHYDAASDAARAGNVDGAIMALEWAASLEREWGDDSYAQEALVSVRGAASGGLVVVETMPDYLRESHRAAGNWGRYPVNGADRSLVSREEAAEIVAADEDEYDHIVGGEVVP